MFGLTARRLGVCAALAVSLSPLLTAASPAKTEVYDGKVTPLAGLLEKMGARLGSALRAQSEQRRTERFQRAEKLAMEAPVKLIGPLMMFIFPVTFIVLGFPIAMKFLNSGML